MREIKFRLRDRHNKIVGYEKWYIGQWHPDNPDEGFSLDSGYWEASPCWLYSVDGERWTPTYIPHRFKDQYTGLKDKNGKESYHKDICDDEEGSLWLVDWSDEYAGFELTLLKSEHSEFPKLNICRMGDMMKVISNIHENLELSEADNERD